MVDNVQFVTYFQYFKTFKVNTTQYVLITIIIIIIFFFWKMGFGNIKLAQPPISYAVFDVHLL